MTKTTKRYYIARGNRGYNNPPKCQEVLIGECILGKQMEIVLNMYHYNYITDI